MKTIESEIQYLLSLSNTITREGAIHLLKTMNK